MGNKTALTQEIRQFALSLGFDACGFSKAGFLEIEARRLDEWLQQNKHASMGWMENNFDKRVNPTLLVPDCKTVISVLAGYYHINHSIDISSSNLKIAKYAQGRDYHKVLKKKLKLLFQIIQEKYPGVEGRFFTDSAPVLDKAWAAKSGLGWIGKHSNLINQKFGSYFFIGEIILDIELDYDSPTTDHCGSCTRCLDACPTNAIYEPYRVDANRCISYLTIEHKEEFNKTESENIHNWIFGCDICQDVCPWNNQPLQSTFEDLFPRDSIISKNNKDWMDLDESTFNDIFEGSAVKRTKFVGLKKNIEAAGRNLGEEEVISNQ